MTESVNGSWPRRTARARETRAAILRAATRLFVDQGYTATTMPAIAKAASVTRATVFNSVGGKAQVLKACYDIAVVGDDEHLPLFRRPEMEAMFAEPDAGRTLERYAQIIAGVGRRIGGLYEVFRLASGADPEARQLWEEIQRERLVGATHFVRMLAAKASLRSDLSAQEAADLVWVHIDNGLYVRLVTERGWSHERFERWFARTLRAQLLEEGGDQMAPP